MTWTMKVWEEYIGYIVLKQMWKCGSHIEFQEIGELVEKEIKKWKKDWQINIRDLCIVFYKLPLEFYKWKKIQYIRKMDRRYDMHIIWIKNTNDFNSDDIDFIMNYYWKKI